MRAIFISYRRDDAEGQSGRLFDDLVGHFGDDSVFMDVAGLEPGRDFRKAIDNQVASCGVLLAVIGKNWLDAKDETGRRRLDDPMDFVRLETASALKRDIPVIPVLVRGASMPRADQLPPDLAELAYRNAVELTHARWDSDVQLLVKALRSHLGSTQSRPTGTEDSRTAAASVADARPARHASRLIAAAVAVLAVTVGGYMAYHSRVAAPAAANDREVKESPSPEPAKPEPATKPLGGDKSSAPDNGRASRPSNRNEGPATPTPREPEPKPAPASKSVQALWRFCHKCQGLFFSGNRSHGVCPADNQPHEGSQSGKYVVTFGESVAPVMASASHPASSGLQGGWRFCHKCQGLFFAGNPSQGICPADNRPHDGTQSGKYAVFFDDGLTSVGQDNWRFCSKCQGLFFAGNRTKGVCPLDHREHDGSQSGKYQLEFESDGAARSIHGSIGLLADAVGGRLLLSSH